MKKIVDINSLVPNLAPLGKVSLFAPTWIILNQKGKKNPLEWKNIIARQERQIRFNQID